MKKDHATYISDTIREYIHRKYLVGQEAHGGNLEKKELLTHAIEEAADLCVYLFTKRDQEASLVRTLTRVEVKLEKAIEETRDIPALDGLFRTLVSARYHLYEGMNILTIGNPEGIEEEEREK